MEVQILVHIPFITVQIHFVHGKNHLHLSLVNITKCLRNEMKITISLKQGIEKSLVISIIMRISVKEI